MPPKKKTDSNATSATPPVRQSSRKKTAAAPPAATATSTSSDADLKPKKRARKAKAKPKDDDNDDDAATDEDNSAPAAKRQKTKESDTADDVEPPKKKIKVIAKPEVDVESNKAFTHDVYEDEQGTWDARLNQTNIDNNNNKFYILQLLHPIGNTNSIELFTHWGRLGERGQTGVKGPFPPHTAIQEFRKQFKSKAGVEWDSRFGMTPKKGKYVWLAPAEEEIEEGEDPSSKVEEEPKPIPESELPSATQELCRLIFSINIMRNTLAKMNYDDKKLPLGKLAAATIEHGFGALKKLSDVLSDPNAQSVRDMGGFNKAINELSGQYYSIIPHAFGRNKPTPIDDNQRLKVEIDLLDSLRDMEITTKMINAKPKKELTRNPLDEQFSSLGLSSMDPVAPQSREWKNLERYTLDTHGKTHHFQTKLLHAFRVERASELEAWDKSDLKLNSLTEGERLLLWHGSRSTNFAGILSQGLRIAPPQAPVTGYMFGKGVYFADVVSKSANYCHAYLSDNVGIMLLCEVAAKPFHELVNADYQADAACKRNGKLATKGMGRTVPVNWQDAGEALDNPALKGVHMPDGVPEDTDTSGAYLQYNEYIVYDVAQIRLRYILMIQM